MEGGDVSVVILIKLARLIGSRLFLNPSPAGDSARTEYSLWPNRSITTTEGTSVVCRRSAWSSWHMGEVSSFFFPDLPQWNMMIVPPIYDSLFEESTSWLIILPAGLWVWNIANTYCCETVFCRFLAPKKHDRPSDLKFALLRQGWMIRSWLLLPFRSFYWRGGSRHLTT